MTSVNISRRTFVRSSLVAGGVLFSGFLFSGCGSAVVAEDAGDPAGTAAPVDSAATGDDSKSSSARPLVMFFTCPEPTGVDTVAGASRVVVGDGLYGNVEYVAGLIAEQAGADVFRIETVQTYPADHDELIEFAVDEQEAEALPELAAPVAGLGVYDTVFLGYPVWNAQLPMPIRTVLDEADFSGKTLVCFTVHGGSGFGGTIDQVAQAEPDAEVVRGFSVSRNDVGSCASDVETWLDGLMG